MLDFRLNWWYRFLRAFVWLQLVWFRRFRSGLSFGFSAHNFAHFRGLVLHLATFWLRDITREVIFNFIEDTPTFFDDHFYVIDGTIHQLCFWLVSNSFLLVVDQWVESVLDHMLSSLLEKFPHCICPPFAIILDWLQKHEILLRIPWRMDLRGIKIVQPALTTLFWSLDVLLFWHWVKFPGNGVPFVTHRLNPKG